MRITYIHQYFTTPDMVGGTRSYEFARRFVEWGHEVTVISSWSQADSRRSKFSTNESGIDVHWIPVPYANEMSHRDRLRAFAGFALLATAHATRVDTDVVFATSTPLTVAIPGVRAARHRRVPLVFEVRDLWPAVPIAVGALQNPVMRGAARRLERWAYQRSEAVIALSPGIRDGITATGYPRARVAVVPNSSDVCAFRQAAVEAADFRLARPWLEDRPLILYAGAVGVANDVGYLVDLAVELREMAPETRILVIGDGNDLARVSDRARAAGVLGRTLFVEPPVPKKEVYAAFAAADVTACLFIDAEPIWTGSPNKLFDSLAAGTPVFVNYGGWQADLLQQSGAGLSSVREPARVAAGRIAALLSDPVALRTAGENAYALALERFDRQDHAGQVLAVLEAAAHGRGESALEVTPRWA